MIPSIYLRLRDLGGFPDHAPRALGLAILLLDHFLMYMGFFMLIPLIAAHFVVDLGWEAAGIGLVLAIRGFTHQGATILSGALADRWGTKGLICWGIAIRAFSFMVMGFIDNYSTLLLVSFITGLGGALFESPKLAATAALTDPTRRRRALAFQATVGNIGMALGVMAGALLMQVSFPLVGLVSGFIYLISLVISVIYLPEVKVSSGQQQLLGGLATAARDRRYLLFSLISVGIFVLWVQMSLGLALTAQQLAGTSAAVSWVYLLNTAISLVLQLPLLRWLESRFSPIHTLILGVAVMSLGLAGVALSHSIEVFMIWVGLYFVGTLVISPSQQTLLAELANPKMLGSYMGFGWLGSAIGGAIGNFSGGILLDWANLLGASWLPWVGYSALGIATSLGLLWFARRYLPPASVQN